MTDSIESILSPIDREFIEGYFDGRDFDSPEPNANRHPAYRHSFEIGRAELAGRPIPAKIARERAAKIEADSWGGVS